MGYELTKIQLDAAYVQFLDVADRQKEVKDDDIHIIMDRIQMKAGALA